MTSTRLVTYETSPWSGSDSDTVPSRRITVHVSTEDVQQAFWARFQDPVSIALRRHLGDHACADVFWNSDSFGPRYPDDEARITINHESYDPATGTFLNESQHCVPLPIRATRAMWRLRSKGIEHFHPFSMRIDVPEAALPQPA